MANYNETEYKEQMKEITDRLETGIKELFSSDKYKSFLDTMSKFHNYSTRNTLLIHMQMPGATHVAGYSAWKEKFNRQVRRGEHGIRIYAPVGYSEKKTKEKIESDTKAPLLDENGNIATEEVEVKIPRFKLIPVFDISQTHGEPLPQLAENITGDVQQYEAFVDTLKAVSPLPISFAQMHDSSDGVCYYGDKIVIREGMSEVQTVSAIVHEITHALLHDKGLQIEMGEEQPTPKDKSTQEVEAESVSYTVCQHFGIETSKNSFGYVASWSNGREMSELKTSLDTIRKTATTLINSIDKEFKEIIKDREVKIKAPEVDTTEIPQPKETIELKSNQHLETIGGVDFIFTGVVPQQEKVKEPPQPTENLIATSEEVSVETIKEYDLLFTYMGNGITVWNKLEEIDNQYVQIAHINTDRSITFYDKNIPDNMKEKINIEAKTSNPTISATQDNFVFHVPPIFESPVIDVSPIEESGIVESNLLLPDSELSIKQRNDYGYTSAEILPLTQLRAIELFDQDQTIYILSPDNSASMVFDRDEILSCDGMFGIEKEEWLSSKEYEKMSQTDHLANVQDEQNKDTYCIYQLKSGEKLHDYRFVSSDELRIANLKVDSENYDLVYTTKLNETDSMDSIYHKFNIDHPEDFKGRSLSISDVVVLDRNNEKSSYYVDSFGFKELPIFLGNEIFPTKKQVDIRSAVKSNYKDMVALVGKDDNVYLGKSENYKNTAYDSSWYDNAEKSLIFISENNKMFYLIYGEGSVKSQQDTLNVGAYSKADFEEFARLQNTVFRDFPYKDGFDGIKFDGQPFVPPGTENPLANAEKSLEQNYNQIDGIVNNQVTTPIVEETKEQPKSYKSVLVLSPTTASEKQNSPSKAQNNSTKKQNSSSKAEKPSILAQLEMYKKQIAEGQRPNNPQQRAGRSQANCSPMQPDRREK